MAGNVAEACQVIDLILSDSFRVFSAEPKGDITELAFVKVSSQLYYARHWQSGCTEAAHLCCKSLPNVHFSDPYAYSLLTAFLLAFPSFMCQHAISIACNKLAVSCTVRGVCANGTLRCSITPRWHDGHAMTSGEPGRAGLYTARAQLGTGQQPGPAAHGLPQPSQEGHHHQLMRG